MMFWQSSSLESGLLSSSAERALWRIEENKKLIQNIMSYGNIII